MVPALDEGADVRHPRGVQQLPKLSQLVVAAVGTRRDQICALTSAPRRVVPIEG